MPNEVDEDVWDSPLLEDWEQYIHARYIPANELTHSLFIPQVKRKEKPAPKIMILSSEQRKQMGAKNGR